VEDEFLMNLHYLMFESRKIYSISMCRCVKTNTYFIMNMLQVSCHYFTQEYGSYINFSFLVKNCISAILSVTEEDEVFSPIAWQLSCDNKIENYLSVVLGLQC